MALHGDNLLTSEFCIEYLLDKELTPAKEKQQSENVLMRAIFFGALVRAVAAIAERLIES